MVFPALCILRATGKTVICQDRSSFSTVSLIYVSSIAGEPPREETMVISPVTPFSADELRFKELKAQRAWLIFKPKEIREEYKALKLKLNK